MRINAVNIKPGSTISVNFEEVVDYLYTMVEEMANNDTQYDIKEIIAGIHYRSEWAIQTK